MNESKREPIISFLKDLRNTIVHEFARIEKENNFSKKEWQHASGGGGEISLLRGKVFEKAAVNWSGVWGPQFPLNDAKGPFFATGVSLITHMFNPHAPTVHMNIRYIETEEGFWFGGGFDLTPMGFFYQEDAEHFHGVAKKALDAIDVKLYPQFSQNAREYFYITHRQKERGIGGLFFDHYNTGNFAQDLHLWQTVGNQLLTAIMPIYHRRISQPFSREEKEKQLEYRAHYVEFNLIYDRGTKFGFQSGGNPEAILCSLPPLAKW